MEIILLVVGCVLGAAIRVLHWVDSGCTFGSISQLFLELARFFKKI